jgi:transcriptional regulator with PAS, ATPase and Fis domain
VAVGGTIFFDEIGNISLKTQVELLRVLEEKTITRVGGNEPIHVDFRVIAATNRDLKEAVSEGTFREDLYYRVNVFSIYLPPLRERRLDIPILAEHFLQKFTTTMRKGIRSISQEAMEVLVSYDWPGNVRELENAIERAVVVGKGPELEAGDLPFGKRVVTTATHFRSLTEMERLHIASVLDETGWNISRAAKLLEIDRVTLYNKINKYGLRREE